MTAKRTVVIGCGNPDRGDDGVGIAAARRLEAAAPPGVDVVVDPGDPTLVVEACRGAEALYVVDACSSGAAPGTVHRIDASTGPVSVRRPRRSSHGFDSADAVELARALGRLPNIVVFYAVEGATFELGAPMSSDVAAAVDRVVADLTAATGGEASDRGDRSTA